MEFDKSKVYTALNADEVKIGSKGYFANNIANLKDKVELSNLSLFEVTEILDESDKFRFKSEVTGEVFNLFYLFEEPQEKKFRPYTDTDEMVEDYKRRYNSYSGGYGKNNPMYNPLVWVKAEDVKEHKYLITWFSDSGEVTMNFETSVYTINLRTLFDDYTYLDGSPCGIEE